MKQINSNPRLEKLLKVTSSLTRMRRLQVQRLCTLHDTPDMRRLKPKLESPDVTRLYEEGIVLVEEEGLDSNAFYSIDLDEARFDLGKETFMLSYEDIKISFEDVDEQILRSISFARLDWLWDFSWSYSMWENKKFPDNSLRLYGLIRGERPRSLHDRPYQIVLNTERKRRIKLWKQKLTRAYIHDRKERVDELLKEPEVLFLVKASSSEDTNLIKHTN